MSDDEVIIDDEKRAMLKRKTIIWSSTLVVLVWFFFWGVPINYMKSMLTFLAILASICITVCFLMTYFGVTFFLFPKKKDNPNEGYIIFAIIMIMFFGTGVMMIVQEIGRENKELAKYGEITEATVTDGNAFAAGRLDLSKIKLVFIMANGEEYTVDEKIPYKVFNNFYAGQKFNIIYSTKHPTIVEVLYRQQELDKYRKIIQERKQ